MGIYIKDMKKPKSCDECPIALWGLPKDCKFVVEMCPIVEIEATHGRLIDADMEIKSITEIIESNSLTEMGWNQYDFCRRILKTAPTVIKSEVE